MIGHNSEFYPLFHLGKGTFAMWEIIVLALCVAGFVWGSQLTSVGSIDNRPIELIAGTFLLVGAAGLMFATALNPETSAWVKTLPYVNVWGWILVVLLGFTGFVFAARGNGTTDIVSELIGATLLVLATWGAFCIVPLDYAAFQQWIGSMPTAIAAPASSVTANVTTPAGSASVTMTPPANTPVIPGPTTPPPLPLPPTPTLGPARVSMVHWKASKPEEVTFDDLDSGKKWAIVYDASNPKGDLVHGKTFTHTAPLTKVQVYEVDVSDTANPRPLTHLTTVKPE